MNVLMSSRPFTRSSFKKNEFVSVIQNQPVIPQTTSSTRRHQNALNQEYEQSQNTDEAIKNHKTAYLKRQLTLKPKQHFIHRNCFQQSHLATAVSDAESVPLQEFLRRCNSETVDRIDSLFYRKELLGEGTYGMVYRSIRKKTGETVALKRLRWQHDEGVPATSTREVVLLRELNHPNIVKLKEVIFESRAISAEGPRLWLEFEYFELDLRKYMKMFEKRRMPLETIRSIIYQLLCGLANCHRHRIIHRDIKPNNILLRIRRPMVERIGKKRPASQSIPRPSSQRRRTMVDDHVNQSDEKRVSIETESRNSIGSAKPTRDCYPVRKIGVVVEEREHSPEQCGAEKLLSQSTTLEKHPLCYSSSNSTGPLGQPMSQESDHHAPHASDKDSAKLSTLEDMHYENPLPLEREKKIDTVEIKIADFGLARSIPFPLRPMTHEVVTLWYRAPEVLMGLAEYTTAIDVWSVGCVLTELLYGRPLFPGDIEIDTLFKIFQFLGTPDTNIWPNIEKYPHYQSVWPSWPRRPDRYDWLREEEDIGVECKHLIDRLLCYDHRDRITCEEALQHPWFKSLSKDDE